jgi:glucuronate isomerase
MNSPAHSETLQWELYEELSKISLIDPHSHINPHSPSSSSLFDLIGYHYYTELAHSAGLPRETIEDPAADGKTKVGRMIETLGSIDNTVQWSWMLALAKDLYDWEESSIDASNWERLFDRSVQYGQQSDWTDKVLSRAGVEKIFLTNDFDDPLTLFDTHRYVPCLRTDDLVFHLHQPTVRNRLEKATNIEINSLQNYDAALEALFAHFTANNAKACAISLPPDFAPSKIDKMSATAAFQHLLLEGATADLTNKDILSYWTFWRLAELCDKYKLPFDLMIGVVRKVYPSGVYQGQDLYDSRVSLIQYAKLFRSFPNVTFPISVLASVTNQELVDYAWIFPNVVTNGHWWYSNTPSFITRDLKARLEAIPRTKQVGYYSDAYKVEFIQPKFDMYRHILARVLAEDFVVARGWSESQAVALGHDVLRGNVERIFFK